MSAASVAGCFRFGRFVAKNCRNFTPIADARSQLKSVHRTSVWTIRRLNATTSENVQNKASESEAEQTTDSEKNVKNDFESLNKEIEGLTQKVQTLEDKYKRSLADGENMRLRLTKQIEDAKLFGIQNFCKDLLEVGDILQRATESVPKEEVTEKNPHLKNLYEGLTMTEAALQNVFRRHGLVPVNPLNEKFNPNFHEALFQQTVEGKEPGTVVVVSKIGYKLHERTIRPALVGVAKSS